MSFADFSRLLGRIWYPNIPSEENIDNILYFPLFWWLFEKIECSNDANFRKIEGLISNFCQIQWLELCLDDLFSIFLTRYKDNTRLNFVFRSPQDDIYRDQVYLILKSTSPSMQERLKACLFIIYRFRNNFFHGEKDIWNIEEQNPIFWKINKLLTFILWR